jgi:hypothetical protein
MEALLAPSQVKLLVGTPESLFYIRGDTLQNHIMAVRCHPSEKKSTRPLSAPVLILGHPEKHVTTRRIAYKAYRWEERQGLTIYVAAIFSAPSGK